MERLHCLGVRPFLRRRDTHWAQHHKTIAHDPSTADRRLSRPAIHYSFLIPHSSFLIQQPTIANDHYLFTVHC